MSGSLEEALGRSPAVRAVWERGWPVGGAWIVGGAVRDALIGREVVDVDVAVADDPAGRARELSRAVGGHAFKLSGEFRTWRTIAPGAGWHADLTPLHEGSLEADLARRDFSVNAAAVPAWGPSGELDDPHGARADLEAGLLRAVSERSFADDPARLLRAARLAAELGLALEGTTVRLARAEAARASEPAGERQLAELSSMLGGPDPLRGLDLLDELGVTGHVLPEVEAMRGVRQTPNHHLDVLGHTRAVLEHLLEIESDLEAYVGERAGQVEELLCEPLADELDRRTALRWGALVHDMGKPGTRAVTDGYVTFIGHDRLGAEIVGELCARLRTSRRLRTHLQGLTRHHLRLGFMVHERPLPCRRAFEYLSETEPVCADVTLLTIADRLSARGTGPIASTEMVAAHLELAREMIGRALEWRRGGAPRPPIRGDELADALGIERGPELGELIESIRAAVFCGELSEPEEAIEHARRLLG